MIIWSERGPVVASIATPAPLEFVPLNQRQYLKYLSLVLLITLGISALGEARGRCLPERKTEKLASDIWPVRSPSLLLETGLLYFYSWWVESYDSAAIKPNHWFMFGFQGFIILSLKRLHLRTPQHHEYSAARHELGFAVTPLDDRVISMYSHEGK